MIQIIVAKRNKIRFGNKCNIFLQLAVFMAAVSSVLEKLTLMAFPTFIPYVMNTFN